jgi:LysM repeat protein
MNRLSVVLCAACVVTLFGGCAYLEPSSSAETDIYAQRYYALERSFRAVSAENARYAQQIAALRSDIRTMQESQRKLAGQIQELQTHVRDRAAQVQELGSLVEQIENQIETSDAAWSERMKRLRQSLETDRQRAMSEMADSVAKEIATQVESVRQERTQHTQVGEYTVQSGDTLSAIAQAFGTTVRQLKEMNGLHSDIIRIGQKLKVPTP